MINKDNLVNYFFEGVKQIDQLKIGVEHEKFILNKDTLKPLTYDESGGIKDIFKSLIKSRMEFQLMKKIQKLSSHYIEILNILLLNQEDR